MKKLLISLFLISGLAVNAQDETEQNFEDPNIIEGMDELEALKILQDLEGLQSDVEQVNQLGKVVPRKYAVLRFLDKLNAEVQEIGLERGKSTDKAHITVTLKACFVPSNRGLKDAAAYLVVQDQREDEPSFDGWMVASSPALSAMDHPRYDVWVDSCSDEKPSIIDEAIQVPPARVSE